MPETETFNLRLAELASRAGDSATLDEAADLRKRGTRRLWRRRGAGAVVGTAAVAAAIGIGLATTGSTAGPQTFAAGQTASSSLSPSAASSGSSASLSAKERAHRAQIAAQLQMVPSYSVAGARYAVIAKSNAYAYEVTFYATPDSIHDVNSFGATWVQVVAGFLEKGFTNVSVETRSDSALPTDAIIDVQNAAGASVLGQRIALSTPIVLVAAG
jgi:hypothetical protein